MRETGKLPDRWRKSSYCDTNSCVEVASIDGAVRVRNSDNPGQEVAFTRREWLLFARAMRDGEFDYLAPESPG